MFGSSDKDQDNNTQHFAEPTNDPLQVSPAPDDNLSMPSSTPLITPSVPPLNDAMMQTSPDSEGSPDVPVIDSHSADELKPKKDHDKPDKNLPAMVTDANNPELFDIKQQALQSLAPLVDKLDQTPEEKFKTTMMLIQASDNPALIKEAYDAANAITEEKTRAQALLDVVNEINYFTQPHNNQQN